MLIVTRFSTFITLAFALTLPLGAQDREGVMGDLIRDITTVETKMIGLARAMPPSAFEWRPSKDARTTSEVFVHVAGDNYYMPVLMGTPAPAETGIDSKGKYKSVETFEKRPMTHDQIIAELEKSFEFLKHAMTDTPDAKLDEQPKFEGRKITTRGLWIATTSHLHEHLGQLIAYARSNNVTPPWSK